MNSVAYTILAIGGLIGALICLVVGTVIFIRWNVPKLFADVTGITKKKALRQIQEEGYHVSSRGHKMSSGDDGSTIRIHTEDNEVQPEAKTTPLSASEAATVSLFASEAETTPLATNARPEEITSVLAATTPGSAPIRQQEGEITTVLRAQPTAKTASPVITVITKEYGDVITLPPERITEKGTVERVLDFVLVHTDEVVS